MPPSLRARGALSAKKQHKRKSPKPTLKKPVLAKDTDDDDDFVQSDTISLSSLSESEEEQELPRYKRPRTAPVASDTKVIDRIMIDHLNGTIGTLNRMIDALNNVITLKDQIMKQKDETIATKTSEIERLQRMVRSLELQ